MRPGAPHESEAFHIHTRLRTIQSGQYQNIKLPGMGWLDIKDRIALQRGAAPSGEALSSPVSSDPTRTPTAEKDSDVDVTVIDQPVQPGELTLDEAARGGLGRHLGLFSTTFLMYVSR